MSDAEKAYQATPASTLEEQIMNPCISKNEREWWAAGEIERLREANEMMLTDIRRTDVDMLAFKAEIERLNNIIQTMRYAEDEDKIKVSMENERLKEKCDKQAMVIRRMFVEEFPDTWFAWHGYGEKDQNGLPQYIEVVPAHGVGWTQVYERTERTISMEGS